MCIRDRWFIELHLIWSIQIERYMYFDLAPLELHIFWVIFARVLLETPWVVFVQSRSRLSPIQSTRKRMKKITIPRLELLSCWLGTRLLQSTIKALNFVPQRITFWSDSMTALSWINSGNDWSVFVQNRVKDIRGSTPDTAQWRHIPGNLNPADLPSRGCYPSEFAVSKWWEGPHLLSDENQWPSPNYNADFDVVNSELK